MKALKITTKLLVVALLLSANAAFAQFQGQITMKIYSENNGVEEQNTLNMFVTANRIMFQGESAFGINEGFDAEGLLIRNDKKDFVVLTGEKSALQVTKKEIESLMNLGNAWGGNSNSSSSSSYSTNKKPNYRYTERTKTVLGYDCTELIIEDEEEEGYISIWLTPDVDINWGMLSEPWAGFDDEMDKAFRTSQDAVFTGKSFPMLVEYHSESEGSKVVAEVTNMNKSSIAKAMVEIPQGVKIMGFGDFMLKMMMSGQ